MINSSDSYDRIAPIPTGIEVRPRTVLATAAAPIPVAAPNHPQVRMA